MTWLFEVRNQNNRSDTEDSVDLSATVFVLYVVYIGF